MTGPTGRWAIAATALLAALGTANAVIAGSGDAGDDGPIAGVGPGALVIAASAALVLVAGCGALRLRRRPDADDPPWALALLALAAAMLVMQQVGAGLGVAAAGGVPAGDAGPGAMARVQSFAAIGAALAQAPAIVALLVLQRRRRKAPGASPPRAAAIGVATGLVMWPIVAGVAAAVAAIQERLGGAPTDALAHETLKLIVRPDARPWSGVLAVLAVVAAPVVEETLYRGLLQPAARAAGAGPWPAIVAVAAIFALMHASIAPPPAIAALFVFAVALGWSKERTGGLAAPIVAHAVFNGANLLSA